MTDAEILAEIKKRFGYNTEHLDETILPFITDVIGFLVSMGVPEEKARSTASVGCIWQGVNDLWSYNAGGAEFSPYFIQRALQLRE